MTPPERRARERERNEIQKRTGVGTRRIGWIKLREGRQKGEITRDWTHPRDHPVKPLKITNRTRSGRSGRMTQGRRGRVVTSRCLEGSKSTTRGRPGNTKGHLWTTVKTPEDKNPDSPWDNEGWKCVYDFGTSQVSITSKRGGRTWNPQYSHRTID